MMLVFCLLDVRERKRERELSQLPPDTPAGQTVMVDFPHKNLQCRQEAFVLGKL